MNLFKKDQLNLKQFSLDQNQKKYSILDYNFKLFFLIIAAMAMGTVIIVSVDETKLTKQLIGAGVCILGMIIVSLIDYNFICKYYMVLYAANIVFAGTCTGGRIRCGFPWSQQMVPDIRFIYHTAIGVCQDNTDNLHGCFS